MAQQFQSPETYSPGQQVTAARLNNMVNNAVPLTGLITDRTNITSNTVATGDSVLLNDVSASALVEATVSDILNSNIDVTTSSISGGTASDITITPKDGTIVTGLSFTSGNGLTVVVTTPTEHGLEIGQVVTTSASTLTGYNGTFRITAKTSSPTFSFTYVMTTAGTVGSGTISYTKQGVVKNVEHQVINGNLYVDGNAVITGTTVQTGAVTQNGSVTQNGTVTQTGTVNVSGSLNVGGTAVVPLVKVAVLTRELTYNTSYTLATGSWTDIPYNTISQTSSFVVNSSSFTGTLSSTGTGLITLPAGTYVIDGGATAWSQTGNDVTVQSRIYNSTAGSLIKKGTHAYAKAYNTAISTASGIVTFSSQTDIKIQYFAQTSSYPTAPTGGDSGMPEVAFIAKITKIA